MLTDASGWGQKERKLYGPGLWVISLPLAYSFIHSCARSLSIYHHCHYDLLTSVIFHTYKLSIAKSPPLDRKKRERLTASFLQSGQSLASFLPSFSFPRKQTGKDKESYVSNYTRAKCLVCWIYLSIDAPISLLLQAVTTTSSLSLSVYPQDVCSSYG